MASTSALRFALVHDWPTVPGGSADVFREICDLFPGVVFTSQWDRNRVRFIADREVRTSIVQRLPGALTRYYLYAPLLPHVYRSFQMDDFDVVLSDCYSFAHGARRRPGGLHISYYHTPPWSPWAAESAVGPVWRLIARRLRRLDLVASRNPDVVFANSFTTADRIRRVYGREVDRVIYPPVDTRKWADVRRESEDAGLIYWGRLARYKRLELLIEAVRRTGDRLQIVGSGPEEKALKAQAAGVPNVTFHGRLSDEDLKALASRCRAFVFPAYADFGVAAVEAMAAGLPVVCYGVGGVAESVWPEFGIRFGVQTADALVEALRLIGTRAFDPEAARAHAAKFDVSQFRSQYREAVETAIDAHFGTSRTGA